MNEAPIVSVIVCTYNRADLLDKCLTSLWEQDLRNELYEIIVVDNNSQDNTAAVVSRYMKENGNVRYVIEENQGHSYARNRGCDEARAEYLVYVDDDVIAPPEYLAAIVEVITEYEPDILGGPVYPYYTSPKPRWFKDKYETKKYEDKSGFSSTCRITGCNFIIRKDVLRQLGMFDVTLGMKGDQLGLGDERAVLEAYRRRIPEANQKVYYALECYIKHYVPTYKMSFKYFVMRSYIGGRTLVQLNNELNSQTSHGMNDRSSSNSSHKTPVRPLVRLPIRRIQVVFHKIKAQALTGIDYIDACRICFFYLGTFVETVNQTLQKLRGVRHEARAEHG